MMLTTNPHDLDTGGTASDGSDDDHFQEECAVYGIFGTPDASAHTALGLHALQHRGQEATGIVSTDGRQFHQHRGQGHVGKNFGEENKSALDALKGFAAIGHNRYATTGETAMRNVQPLYADLEFGGLALCHNGNLTNALQLRRELVRQGSIFQSTTDTETILQLIARSRHRAVNDRLVDAMRQVEGAFALVVLTANSIIGLRDPYGVRPLVLGQIGDAYIMTSETVALDIIGAEFIRDVEPGEMVVIDENGVRSFFPFTEAEKRFCIFEYIYFARPDSIVEGHSVYTARKAIGAELAKEAPIDADVIIPVPDSGVPAAIGYAGQAGIPFELGIIRNHYVGRTFIQPSDHVRHLGVKLKHNANPGEIAGKRVVLVDDSIVRGTTSTKIVEMVRQAGAKEVHMRIASPPTTHSCFYGVDTPEREKLLAARMSIEEMGKLIGVDTLAFISIDGLYRAMGEARREPNAPQYCDACLTGEYPIRLADREDGNAAPQLSLLAAAV
jgi:amidophosphoribosyltransferase